MAVRDGLDVGGDQFVERAERQHHPCELVALVVEEWGDVDRVVGRQGGRHLHELDVEGLVDLVAGDAADVAACLAEALIEVLRLEEFDEVGAAREVVGDPGGRVAVLDDDAADADRAARLEAGVVEHGRLVGADPGGVVARRSVR